MHIPLPKSLKPARKGRWLMYWEGEVLVIRPPRDRRGFKLDTSAVAVWQLCDGSRSLLCIRDTLKDFASESGADPDDLLSETVKQLYYRGLVELRPSSTRPVLRMAYRGFPEHYDRHDNFFLNLFSEWIDILIVEACEHPEILLHWASAPDETNGVSVPLRVLVDEMGTCESTGFDLVFTTEQGRHRYTSDAIVLPDEYDKCFRLEIRDEDREKLRELLSVSADDERDSDPVDHRERKLTIGMATYDDYDGVYFTVQSIRLGHPEVTSETEILVIDNNPGGACAEDLQILCSQVEGCRYVANDEIRGTAVRDFVFREARTKYVMCIDSHVLIEPGAIRRLIDYFDMHLGTLDLLQGPLVNDDLRGLSTHFDPVWKQGMFGVWGCDDRGIDMDAEPFEIPMQGLGLAACRKVAWQGYNHRFHGFGGEEGYIHQKFRNAGGRVLCLPFLRWMHRFARPMGVPYQVVWEDRIRNYLIGFEEVGLDLAEVRDHFSTFVNPEVVARVGEQVANEAGNPFDFFDAIYCINLASEKERWLRLQRRLRRLGIEHRVRRFEAIETPTSHHIGCALSHRAIVAEAKNKGYRNVLVLEDDVLFHDKALEYLTRSLDELAGQQWQVFYLGGMKWGRRYGKLPHCDCLERPEGMTCAHALAYHETFYDRLLQDLPSDIEGMSLWIKNHAGIDQYLPRQGGLVVMSPVIATQATILASEDEDQQGDFY